MNTNPFLFSGYMRINAKILNNDTGYEFTRALSLCLCIKHYYSSSCLHKGSLRKMSTMKGVSVCSPNTFRKFLGYAINLGLIKETDKGYVVRSLYVKKYYWKALRVEKYIDNNKYWKDANNLLGKELTKRTLERRKKLGKATKSLTVKNFINIIQALRVDTKLASCDYKYHKMAIRAGRTHDGFEFTLKCDPKKIRRLTSDVEKIEAYDNGVGLNKIAMVMGVCRDTAFRRMRFLCDNGMYRMRHNRKCIEEIFDLDFCKKVHGAVNVAQREGKDVAYFALSNFSEFYGKRVIITNNNSILVNFANTYIPNANIRENRMCKRYYRNEVRKEALRNLHAKKEKDKSCSSSQSNKPVLGLDTLPY